MICVCFNTLKKEKQIKNKASSKNITIKISADISEIENTIPKKEN